MILEGLPDRGHDLDLRQGVRPGSRISERLARAIQHGIAAPRNLQQAAVRPGRQTRRGQIDHPVALQRAGTRLAFNGKCKQLHCFLLSNA
jgi:hypothetical protein